jgi:UDP-glucose 4-epimerase
MGRRENLNPAAKFYELDLRDGDIESLFETERPDYVHHYAAQIDVRKSVDDPAWDAHVNVIGSLRLLEACRKYPVQKFINISTGGAIYGEPESVPTPESHRAGPDAPYGISKRAVELYVQYYGKIHSLRWTILRLANVYGPRQGPLGEAGVNAIFIGKMLEGVLPRINGDGEQVRDYVYVDDVVEADMRAVEAGDGEIINIGTGVPTSVNGIYELLQELIGFDIPAEHGPAIPGEVLRIYLDNSRARHELDWAPQVDLKEGLRRTVECHHSTAV